MVEGAKDAIAVLESGLVAEWEGLVALAKDELQCGRAEADSDNSGRVTLAPALVDHKPLRYRQ